MNFQRPTRDAGAPPSLLTRWLALACLLLVSVVGTAQAVHIHGDWLPKADHQLHEQASAAQTVGGEERCPLCVAMHSALPSAAVVYMAVERLEPALVADQAELTRETQWHFAWFSRPPPSQTL